MCTIKFSIELNIFQIDDKDITTSNICEKCAQMFKMDDASVCHPPVYLSFLDDSPVRYPSRKVLKLASLCPYNKNSNYIKFPNLPQQKNATIAHLIFSLTPRGGTNPAREKTLN